MKHVFLCLVSLSLLFAAVHVSGEDLVSSGQYPFVPGEKLTFALKWGKISAGEATLEVLPIEYIDDLPVFHFVMTARTNSFVDVFYKVRDRVEGYATLDMNRSVLYKTKQREGKYKRDILVNFDWETQQAQYSNKGKAKAPISISEGSFDPLSALYYTRMVELRENTQITRPVTDGKKRTMGVVSVHKRETVKVSDETYDVFLVEPDTKNIGGVFKKSDDATIQLWLTSDERRLPVKIRSKVAVGSFIGELVKIEGSRLVAKQPE